MCGMCGFVHLKINKLNFFVGFSFSYVLNFLRRKLRMQRQNLK